MAGGLFFRCLDLMNRSALHVMQSFYPNIIMAYGINYHELNDHNL